MRGGSAPEPLASAGDDDSQSLRPLSLATACPGGCAPLHGSSELQVEWRARAKPFKTTKTGLSSCCPWQALEERACRGSRWRSPPLLVCTLTDQPVLCGAACTCQAHILGCRSAPPMRASVPVPAGAVGHCSEGSGALPYTFASDEIIRLLFSFSRTAGPAISNCASFDCRLARAAMCAAPSDTHTRHICRAARIAARGKQAKPGSIGIPPRYPELAL